MSAPFALEPPSRLDPTATAALATGQAGRVVGLGALCDLDPGGLDVTATELRHLPYEVRLTDEARSERR